MVTLTLNGITIQVTESDAPRYQKVGYVVVDPPKAEEKQAEAETPAPPATPKRKK